MPSKLQSCTLLKRQTTDHSMLSTTDVKPASKRRLKDSLVKASLWILLFATLTISYLLYSWEKAAPPSTSFWMVSSYGLVTLSSGSAASCSVGRSSSSYRLIEPSVMYLTLFINFFRVPRNKDRAFYDPHSFEPLLMLVYISMYLLWLHNHSLRDAGRSDRVVNARYIVGIWNAI
ncbi:hypothetical protein DFH06DRAFT_730787 [Mycena polygramma]|nr:hypothetical protein DFH06DRAFT_730787 [Mycena polygramma]